MARYPNGEHEWDRVRSHWVDDGTEEMHLIESMEGTISVHDLMKHIISTVPNDIRDDPNGVMISLNAIHWWRKPTEQESADRQARIDARERRMVKWQLEYGLKMAEQFGTDVTQWPNPKDFQ